MPKEPTSGPSIAVVGIGCLYPGARTARELWENILSRRRQMRRIPDVRLPLADYYDPDPSAPDKSYAMRAAVIDGFRFDWQARKVPRSTYETADIVHWLALEVAYQALSDAGYTRDEIPSDKAGVILGNTLTGEQTRATTLRQRWPFVRRALHAAAEARGLSSIVPDLERTMEEYYKSVFPPTTEDSLSGGLSNTIAGRICNRLNFRGGGYTVDGACASSLIAVATAASALVSGDLDFALAGGVDVSLDTFELIGFAKTGALTQADMTVYDRRASGFIPGEGCGLVALKRLDDAQAGGDYVYAVLRGWGISSDGRGSLTAPTKEGQATALRRAYARAGYSPRENAFFEGHGTGTKVGDRTELEGIALAIGPELEGIAPATGPELEGIAHATGPERFEGDLRAQAVTSFKSLVGHTKAAAGVGGLIKAVLAVNRRIIPPTAGCREPNPAFLTHARSLYPALQGEVCDPGVVMRAGVSAMGFGGINCHVAIESGNAPAPKIQPSLSERALLVSHQDTEILPFGAESVPALVRRIEAVKRLAFGLSLAELVDLAAHLAEEKPGGALRAAVVVETPEDLVGHLDQLIQQLQEAAPAEGKVVVNPSRTIWLGNRVRADRVGFVFPGQASHQINMARVLVERHAWARDMATSADRWLVEAGFAPVGPCIWKPLDRAVNQEQAEAWASVLGHTAIAQPAICLASMLWTRALHRLGITAVAVAGHSLGELTALWAAGAYDDRALMLLAALRGRAMSHAADGEPGAMASVRCSEEKAIELCRRATGYVVVANINSPMQTVVSGEQASVAAVIEMAKCEGIRTHRLPVSNAFHSRFVSKAADVLRANAPVPETLGILRAKFLSGLDGRERKPGTLLRDTLARQVLSPVDFVSLSRSLSQECDVILEVGPGRALSGLVCDTVSAAHCLPVASQPCADRDLHTALAALFVHGNTVRWQVLYEERMTRPFVPASGREFIESHCERPFPNGDRALESPRRTGAESAVRTGAESAVRTGAGLGEGIGATTPRTEARPEASLAVRLSEMIAARTGYAAATIGPELRLLDDLNLDSIKAGELIAAAAHELGVAGKVDPALFANAPLRELANALDSARSQLQASDRSPATPSVDPLRPSWVRDFSVDLVSAPLESVAYAALRGANVLLVNEPDVLNEQSLVSPLREALFALGAQSVEVVCFAELSRSMSARSMSARPTSARPMSARSGEVTHVIAVLPPTWPRAQDLQRTVERLRAVAVLAATIEHGTLAFVEFGGGHLGFDAALVPSSLVSAFAASLHLERPGLKVRVVDLCSGAYPEACAARVIDELSSEEAFDQSRYDAEFTRHSPRVRVREPAEYVERTVVFTPEDVMLITGGAKGITAECALGLAAKTGVRVALVGSSEPKPGCEIEKTLERFRAAGRRAQYYRCDLTDRAAVEDLVATVKREMGPITGVVHGAAVNRIRRAHEVSGEAAWEEIAPKVVGALHLLASLHDASLKIVAGLTSIIGVTGMAGNAWYAFSNQALKVVLLQYRATHPRVAVLAVAFSVWGETGMGARMGSTHTLGRMGTASIANREGVDRFVRLFERDPGTLEVVVAARVGGLSTWRALTGRGPASNELPIGTRYLEEIVDYEPGVEVRSRAHLLPERDAYLADHVYRDSLLFPTVFGLEAMAQAVALATGRRTLRGPLRIENLELTRPIVADPKRGVTIEIRAHVEERDAPNSPQRVRVGIGAEQTGFTRDHFTSTFVLDLRDPAPSERLEVPTRPLDIDPQQDLYGSLLFQGPLFRRLSAVHHLDSSRSVLRARVSPYLSQSDGAAATMGPFVLGDPYFRDALLQAPQLHVTRHSCLPVAIDHLALFDFRADVATTRAVVARLVQCDDQTLVEEVTAVDGSGRVVEKLCGYRLQLLEERTDHPTPQELAEPTAFDARRLRDAVRKAAADRNVTAPEIAIGYMSDLHDLDPPARHVRQTPLLVEAVRRACGTDAVEPIFDWQDGVRPLVRGPQNLAEIGVSLSHDDRLCLSVAGPGTQGCEVAPIRERAREHWLARLGEHRAALLDEVTLLGDPPAWAGTRLWAAAEASRKAISLPTIDLAVEKAASRGRIVCFRAGAGDRKLLVMTFPMLLTRGPERIFALVVRPVVPSADGVLAGREVEVGDVTVPEAAAPDAGVPEAGAPDAGVPEAGAPGAGASDAKRRPALRDPIRRGPQGQPIVSLQIPLTFHEMAALSGSLHFTHYFRWMGMLREIACQPVYEHLARELTTGAWGMVTNRAETRIVGNASAQDHIEGRMWVERVYGPVDSTMDLRFEWRRELSAGSDEIIAQSAMTVTWVALLDHGKVEARPFPAYFRDFLAEMAPQPRTPSPTSPIRPDRPPPSNPALGGVIRHIAQSPERRVPLLEQCHDTSLEEGNLVGNVYFAHYAVWQGRAIDQLFHGAAPEYFRARGRLGELRCCASSIDHLREAMPFDRIAVRLELCTLYERGVHLLTDYFRVTGQGEYEKLARGEHQAVWMAPDRGQGFLPAPLPNVFRSRLLAGRSVEEERTDRRQCSG